MQVTLLWLIGFAAVPCRFEVHFLDEQNQRHGHWYRYHAMPLLHSIVAGVIQWMKQQCAFPYCNSSA